jgi:hypothetical protein
MPPAVARHVLVALDGGLRLELCAVLGPLSLRALYRLVCAFGHARLGTVWTRCGLPLPTYVLADAKPSHCLTDTVYWLTMVRRRMLWQLGYPPAARAAAGPASSQMCPRAAVPQEPA